jgi:hypothetical protein
VVIHSEPRRHSLHQDHFGPFRVTNVRGQHS